MTRFFSIIIVLVGMTLPSPSLWCQAGTVTSPIPNPEKGTVVGQGAIPCKKYYKKSLDKKNDFIVWVQGYFTAYNAIIPDTLNIAGDRDYNWIRQKLDVYCEANPDKYFNDAVAALVEELYPARSR